MPDETEPVDFDRRGAYLTFDALERAACWAVGVGEMEVAAEYVEALMLHASQLEEWHADYMDESEVLAKSNPRIAVEQNEVTEMIQEVQQWALEHDHPVAEWFEAAEQTEDGDSDV